MIRSRITCNDTPAASPKPLRRWDEPVRRWIYSKRWKPGAPTRCSRRHDRPHRLGSGPPALSGLSCYDSVRAGRDHKFSARYPSVEKEGAVSQAGNIRPVSPETNCDLEKSDPAARDRFEESRRVIRIGGVGVRERDAPAPGPWDPPPCRQARAASGIWSAIPGTRGGGSRGLVGEFRTP
jgi:hypothetical protein